MRNARWILAVTAIVALACGGGGGETASESASRVGGDAEAAAAGQPAPPVDPASIPADRAGAFELDGTEYLFLVVRCDLTGRTPDGMLLRGNGTAPDGRRMSVEVERLARGETVNERATVVFGSIVDGDHWTARGVQWPDGRWFQDEAGDEPADGPLIRISGNELVVEAAFEHETDDASRPGALRAVCPG